MHHTETGSQVKACMCRVYTETLSGTENDLNLKSVLEFELNF